MAKTQEPLVIAIDDLMRAKKMLMAAGRRANSEKVKTTNLAPSAS